MALQDTLRNAFIYSPDLTPVVTSIIPSSGPLNGGTVVTFQGRGLVPEGDFADYFDGWFLSVPGLGPAGTVNATEVSDSSNMVCHALLGPKIFPCYACGISTQLWGRSHCSRTIFAVSTGCVESRMNRFGPALSFASNGCCFAKSYTVVIFVV